MSLNPPDHSLDGQSNSQILIGLSACLGVLCTLAVGARIYTRAVRLKNAGMDDATIVTTQVGKSEQLRSYMSTQTYQP